MTSIFHFNTSFDCMYNINFVIGHENTNVGDQKLFACESETKYTTSVIKNAYIQTGA